MKRIVSVMDRLQALSGGARPTVRLLPDLRASEAAIDAWEARLGRRLPGDYRQFLIRIGSCLLHGQHEQRDSFAVRLFGLAELEPYREIAFSPKYASRIPQWWYAIGDLHDNNFVVMDLASRAGDETNIIDGFSEAALIDAPVIARSFTEFLEHSIEDADVSSGSGNDRRRYWSRFDLYYGDARTAAGNS